MRTPDSPENYNAFKDSQRRQNEKRQQFRVVTRLAGDDSSPVSDEQLANDVAKQTGSAPAPEDIVRANRELFREASDRAWAEKIGKEAPGVLAMMGDPKKWPISRGDAEKLAAVEKALKPVGIVPDEVGGRAMRSGALSASASTFIPSPAPGVPPPMPSRYPADGAPDLTPVLGASAPVPLSSTKGSETVTAPTGAQGSASVPPTGTFATGSAAGAPTSDSSTEISGSASAAAEAGLGTSASNDTDVAPTQSDLATHTSSEAVGQDAASIAPAQAPPALDGATGTPEAKAPEQRSSAAISPEQDMLISAVARGDQSYLASLHFSIDHHPGIRRHEAHRLVDQMAYGPNERDVAERELRALFASAVSSPDTQASNEPYRGPDATDWELGLYDTYPQPPLTDPSGMLRLSNLDKIGGRVLEMPKPAADTALVPEASTRLTFWQNLLVGPRAFASAWPSFNAGLAGLAGVTAGAFGAVEVAERFLSVSRYNREVAKTYAGPSGGIFGEFVQDLSQGLGLATPALLVTYFSGGALGPQALAALSLGPGLIDSAGNRAVDAYENGKTYQEALSYVARDMGATIITSKLPFSRFLGKANPDGGLLNDIIREFIEEAPKDAANTVLQKLNDYQTLYPDKPISDFFSELPGDITQGILSKFVDVTMGQGFKNIGKDYVKEYNKHLIEEYVNENNLRRKVFGSLSDQAKYYRSSGSYIGFFEEFIDGKIRGTRAEYMYVSSDVFYRCFSGPGSNPRNVARQLGIPISQFNAAVASRGELKFSTGRFLDVLAGTKRGDALLSRIRFNPGDVTLGEAIATNKEAMRVLGLLSGTTSPD